MAQYDLDTALWPYNTQCPIDFSVYQSTTETITPVESEPFPQV